jgi:cytochrome c peroxidase
MRRRITAGAFVLPAVFVLSFAGLPPGDLLFASDGSPAVPAGLPPLVWPAGNPYSPEKAELGRYLYFDRRLSSDGTVSCASCHDPKHGFTDGAALSTGVRGQKGTRSAPTILNRAYSLAQFWDGRSATLEEQAVVPMESPIEMGNTHQAIVATVSGIAGYRAMFAKAFGSDAIDIDRVTMAIACFERTVLSGNAPYDRYKRGIKSALSEEQVRGMAVFFDKASCDRCHQGANFTSNAYANEGIGTDKPDPDVGRFAVTHQPRDWGAFKIPTLRDVEHTAPYMHDGSLKTLLEVVEFYNRGGIPNPHLDANIRPLHLSDQQKQDLMAFLRSLSGEGWQWVKAPDRFPQ